MPESTFTIGSEPDNDLQVSVPQVSRHHVRLSKSLDGLFIEDLKSTNHTYVDGKEVVNKTPVRVGSEVLLSKHFRLNWNHAKLKAWIDEALPGVERSTFRGVTSEFNLRTAKGSKLTVGRGSDCDLVFPHPRVSRVHARLTRISGDEWQIEDLHSANGTFVDGKRVTQSIINPRSTVALSGLRIQLFPAADQDEVIFRLGEARFEIQGVSYEIPVHDGRRTLLDDISLVIQPGEFVGLIGPSGSGKTTLMLMMNGYNIPSAGVVRINEVDLHKERELFQGFIGYVPQDDIIHRELVVERSLRYSAQLRLPDLAPEEHETEVNRVIHELDLETARRTEIGTPEKKGISGGQRKRVNLAQELITQPSVLFLDEPCSGLDPRSDSEVIHLLRGMSRKGKTIVLTTHNISVRNFELMDTVIVLADGGVLAYYGPAADVAHYFGVTEPEMIFDVLKSAPKEEWQHRFRSSPYYQTHVAGRMKASRSASPSAPSQRIQKHWKQLFVLSLRYFEIKWRDRLQSAILLAQAPIIALLLALVFGNLGQTQERPFPFVTPLFLLVVSAIWLGASNATREIVLERAIYRRERSVFLTVPNYLSSKLGVLALFDLVQCVVLLAISYLFSHLSGSFVAHLFVLFEVSVAATAMGLVVSSLATSEASAMALVPLVLIPQVVLGGLIVGLNDMPPLIKILAGTMMSRWGFEGAMLVENSVHDTALFMGRSVTLTGMYGLTSGNIPADLVMIALWLVVYIMIAFMRLSRSH